MSENQNGRIRDLSKYDAMTTEELETILRLDVDAPDGQGSDTDTILYVMGVLADRRKINGHAENEALKAYESFKQNYMPEIEDAPKTVMKQKRSRIGWLRGMSAVAALLVIILLGTVTAKAFGLDIWEAVVTWTQETFQFARGGQTDEPNKSNNLPYSSLQEALLNGKITEPLVPTWIPDGYHLTDITIEQTPLQKVYNAYYQNGESSLKITIRDYLNSNPEFVEQSDEFLETYEAAGITYYLFSNHDFVKAVWIKDSFECYISGNLTIEELKLMIDSI